MRLRRTRSAGCTVCQETVSGGQQRGEHAVGDAHPAVKAEPGHSLGNLPAEFRLPAEIPGGTARPERADARAAVPRSCGQNSCTARDHPLEYPRRRAWLAWSACRACQAGRVPGRAAHGKDAPVTVFRAGHPVLARFG